MKTKDRYYVGTDLKFLLKIEAPGFNQADDEYEIRLECEDKSLVVQKSDMVEGEEGFYLLVDTSELGEGMVKMIITAKVVDEDFPKGYRREVVVRELCYIRNI